MVKPLVSSRRLLAVLGRQFLHLANGPAKMAYRHQEMRQTVDVIIAVKIDKSPVIFSP
jgi:hypothetical protein